MKKRVAYVINYIKNGGPSNVIRNIIFNLETTAYEPVVLTLFPKQNDNAVVQELQDAGVQVISCNGLSRLGCLLGQDREFRQLIKGGDYDVIHTHGMIPDILSSRLKTNAVQISTIHNNMFEDYLEAYGALKSKLYIFIHLHCLAKLDYQICCSKSVFEALSMHLPNASYIRNGISNTVIKQEVTRQQLGMNSQDVVYIYVGQLRKRKNIVWLLKQFKKTHCSNEHLLVLGRGSEEEACRKIEDPNIHIIGFSTNAAAYLAISDVYVSASTSEGFSMAVLEALNSGLLLLLSDIPSHEEIFQIDKELYLGERYQYNETSFNTAISTIRKHIPDIEKKKIIDFQESYLSNRVMTNQYAFFYGKSRPM